MLPALKDGPYHRLVRCLLQARKRGDTPAALGPGEVAVLLDGGKAGNVARLLAPWKEETRAAGAGKRKERTEDDDDDDAEEEDEEDDERGEGEKKPGFVPCRLTLVYTEVSVSKRRKLTRGTVSIKQLEQCHIAGSTKISLPERPHKHLRKQLWRRHCWADDAGP